jgi:transcriptional regulator with XRE-family HTH domain
MKVLRQQSMSQTELGELCVPPITQTTISQIEGRVLNPTEEQINSIAKVLKYTYAPASLLLEIEAWEEQYGKMDEYQDRLIGVDDEIIHDPKGK